MPVNHEKKEPMFADKLRMTGTDHVCACVFALALRRQPLSLLKPILLLLEWTRIFLFHQTQPVIATCNADNT